MTGKKPFASSRPTSLGALGKWISALPSGTAEPSPPEGEGGEALASPGEGVKPHPTSKPWRLSVDAINTKLRPSERKANARRLRGTMTDAELALWRLLRSRRLEGHKFQRQHSVGPYIADFICLEAKLIIEADGGQHADCSADLERTKWLEASGFKVLRFWNNDILSNPDGVTAVLVEALGYQSAVVPYSDLQASS